MVEERTNRRRKVTHVVEKKSDCAMMYARLQALLRKHGLRVTEARLDVAACLFFKEHRHINATMIAQELTQHGSKHAPASVYNALNDFARADLIRSLSTEGAVRWFDTNLQKHHHAIDHHNQIVIDVPEADQIASPSLPPGYRVLDYHITYRVTREVK